MTVLRVTPISGAVWPHERPASRHRFSISMRSKVQVAQLADMFMACWQMMVLWAILKIFSVVK
jgi:hypothetical protein